MDCQLPGKATGRSPTACRFRCPDGQRPLDRAACRGSRAWPREQIAAGKLAITWVNHSFTHFYDPDAPLENFLLRPGTYFVNEAPAPGTAPSSNRACCPHPSSVFRVSSPTGPLIEQLRLLSLIPVGADAWLAKGETPQPGSIILVHANGNEPEGVRRLMAFYVREGGIASRQEAPSSLAGLPSRAH